jgi:hypothetical protein
LGHVEFKNFSLSKGGKIKLQFRSEFFNVFNRVRFAYPNTTQRTANFGVISSQLNNLRLVQLHFTSCMNEPQPIDAGLVFRPLWRRCVAGKKGSNSSW